MVIPNSLRLFGHRLGAHRQRILISANFEPMISSSCMARIREINLHCKLRRRGPLGHRLPCDKVHCIHEDVCITRYEYVYDDVQQIPKSDHEDHYVVYWQCDFINHPREQPQCI